MVALSLFDSLLSLNNEEILMELILKHVVNAPHVPVAQKHKINRINSYTKTIEFFIDLAPEVMKNSTKIMAEYNSMDHQQPMLVPSSQASVSRTIGANWNHYAMHNGDTLYSNYHAYLYDAHQKIKIIRKACRNWSENYFYKPPIKPRMNQQKTPNEQTIQLIKSFLSEFHVEPLPEENLMLSSKQLDSLQSIGESSGYESIKYRLDEDEESTSEISQQKSYNDSGFSATINNNGNGNVTITKNVEPWRTSRYRQDQTIEMELSEDIFTQGTVSLGNILIESKTQNNFCRDVLFLGPFLTSIWSKLQTFTSNSLYVNVHLTGIISRCATFPLPLVHSILLRPDIPTTSDIPSFYQVLKILKQQIDSELPLTEESLEMIDVGRTFLIDREFKLINARKIALEALKQNASQNSKPNTSQVQNNDPFKRQEAKRKSTGNSLMNIFRRPTTSNNVQGK